VKWKRKKIPTRNAEEAEPVTIIHDAAMANPEFGEGRLIPLVILDVSNRPDVTDLISLHSSMPPGDVKVTWGRRTLSKKKIFLLFQFARPTEITICLEFNVEKYGALVDLVIGSQALYIQGGKSGDKLATTLDEPRIIIEVPDTGFSGEWGSIWAASLVKSFRNRGLTRKEAKKAVFQHIESLREARKVSASPA
jgi:hypothetical protein